MHFAGDPTYKGFVMIEISINIGFGGQTRRSSGSDHVQYGQRKNLNFLLDLLDSHKK